MLYAPNPRRNIQALVPEGARRVLDVGCNTGDFGGALRRDRRIEVWGIEPNPAAATIARGQLDKVICEHWVAGLELPAHHFDAIVFNDVLEHMVDPWAGLRLATGKLSAGGRVVASLPNFLQVDNLLHVLLDRDFRYEDQGIRDRTHLRFFTKTSALRLFEETGYEVQECIGVNETWWTPSLFRRAIFRALGTSILLETKFNQIAIVALPKV
jgi:SAM-dependent methyltransferase